MDTVLVRLKPYDPRRRHLLRRYTYRGLKFHEERGWYRVHCSVGDYLKTVRQVFGDVYSPLAFDVCTEDEAKALEGQEKEAVKVRKDPTEAVQLSESVKPSSKSAVTKGSKTKKKGGSK